MVRSGIGGEKTKVRLLVRAYLIFNETATAVELSDWLNQNFRWNSRISPRVVGGILKGRNPGGVLSDLGKRRISSNTSEYYYFLKKKGFDS